MDLTIHTRLRLKLFTDLRFVQSCRTHTYTVALATDGLWDLSKFLITTLDMIG